MAMGFPIRVHTHGVGCVETETKRDGGKQQPGRSLGLKELSQTSFAKLDQSLLDGTTNTPTTLPALLKQCGKAKALDDGKILHAHICKFFNVHSTFLGNCLVDMYGNCGSMEDAASVFHHIRNLNLYSWNILINAYAKNGLGQEALQLYHHMQHHGFAPNPHTFVCALNACAISVALPDVHEIHAAIIDNGYIEQVIVCTALIHVYSKSGSLDHARIVFDHIPVKDVVSWNAMLAACTQNGSYNEALVLFRLMQDEGFKPNHITFVCAVDACASLAALQDGKEIYAAIVSSGYIEDIVVSNALVNMYGKCGSLEDARNVFFQMPQRDVVSWSTMIAACVQNGHGKEGLDLFYQMQHDGIEPNPVTLLCAIDACASRAVLEEGKEIHALVAKSRYARELAVVNALISMYGKCRSLHDAKNVFDQVCKPNVVTWNAMIAVYAQNGRNREALDFFKQMQHLDVKPNQITLVCVLDACAWLADLQEGQKVNDAIIGSEYQEDVMVGTSLVNMYSKCGDLHNAKIIFDQIPQKDVVLWSAMVAACAQNGHDEEALQFFHQMQLGMLVPDPVTFVCALNACSNLSGLEEGRKIHTALIIMGYEEELQVGTALVDMYGKCGSLGSARNVFVRMAWRDVVTWNSMVAACAQNGYGEEAIALFHEMQQDGIKPDGITFISVLSACNHMGRVDDGKQFFVSMNKDYGITHTAEHYLYMIDLLSRAGHVHDAEALIHIMPFEKNAKLWLTLLGACSIHGDLEQALHAARHVFQMDPENAAPYVLLSNMYAAASNGVKPITQCRLG